MNILVTGTAGFIGFHLTKKLIDNGHNVYGLDQINDYYDVNIKYDRLKLLGFKKHEIEDNILIKSNKYNNLKFIRASLEDISILQSLFKNNNFDAVCNLAAQAGVRYSLENPSAYINSNIVGFTNILECCRNFNVDNFSYASSSSVYGLNSSLPFSTNDNVDHPISLYAASKKSNELIAHTYSYLFKIKTTGLRFFTVYGPWGRPDMALFLFVKAALENKKINVFNHGNMVRDFTYIDDIIKGVINVIENPAKKNKNWNRKPEPSSSVANYKIYNIGNNNPIKLLDFIKAIENKLKISIKKDFLPIQPGDVPETYANVDSLVDDFDYKPKTTIKYGVDKFIDWYLNYYEN